MGCKSCKLTWRQREFLQALFKHPQWDLLKAANKIGLAQWTLTTWMSQPGFMTRLEAALVVQEKTLARRMLLGQKFAAEPAEPEDRPAEPDPQEDEKRELPPLTREKFEELKRRYYAAEEAKYAKVDPLAAAPAGAPDAPAPAPASAPSAPPSPPAGPAAPVRAAAPAQPVPLGAARQFPFNSNFFRR
jgi:hypothetical protein